MDHPAKMAYESNNPSSIRQLSDSGSPEQGTSQSSNMETFGLNQRLNKFLISSRETVQKADNSSEITSAISQLLLLAQKINFLKNNNRNYDPIIQLLCYYNISGAYQVLTFNKGTAESIEECLKFLEKSISLNLKLISINKKVEVKLRYLYIKMNIQHCALLSQTNDHKKAFEISIRALKAIKDLFTSGYTLCDQQLAQLKGRGSDEKISFTQNVLKKAKQLLKKLRSLETPEELMTNDQDQEMSLKKLKEKNYFWQSNFENNQKTIRKQFFVDPLQHPSSTAKPRNSSKQEHIPNRNILGLKVSNDWIKTFTIGKIMHIVPLKYQDYCEADNLVIEFSYRNLIEKVFLVSSIYFSISTQMRFLQGETDTVKKQKAIEKIAQKQQIKKSQIFHVKAIEIICKHLKESSVFIDHLINSYHRHYNTNLATIEEEPSYAEYSLRSTYNLNTVVQERKKEKKAGDQNYDESYSMKRENKEREGSTLFIFSKNKKQNLLESGELERDFSRSSKRIGNNCKVRGVFKKMDLSRKKSEKSISSTHFHSMKSADKKSFSIHANKDTTKVIKSKSPELSFRNCKLKTQKSLSKKSNIRLNRR